MPMIMATTALMMMIEFSIFPCVLVKEQTELTKVLHRYVDEPGPLLWIDDYFVHNSIE